MRYTYDDEADALYIRLAEDTDVDRSVVIDDDRVIDLDRDGHPVGIEVLGASRVVPLNDLIERFALHEYSERFRNLETSNFRRAAKTGGRRSR